MNRNLGRRRNESKYCDIVPLSPNLPDWEKEKIALIVMDKKWQIWLVYNIKSGMKKLVNVQTYLFTDNTYCFDPMITIYSDHYASLWNENTC